MEDKKQLIQEFAELKKESKVIEAKLEELKPSAYEALFEIGLDEEHPVEIPGTGCFSYGNRPSYAYSSETKELKKILDAKQKEEVQLGIAVKKDSPYAIFKAEGEE